MEGGEEIPRGFIVARRDAAELFEFAKEILDQVACLVEHLIELAGRCSVLPRRDDGGFSGTRQRLEDAIVGIRRLCRRSRPRRPFAAARHRRR